ncbi:MAG: hypothetical protein AAF802_31925 [Planctomycetota bacterium]
MNSIDRLTEPPNGTFLPENSHSATTPEPRRPTLGEGHDLAVPTDPSRSDPEPEYYETNDPLQSGTREYIGAERRRKRRLPRTLEIRVQPLDDQLNERGDSFFAITRDISQGGLAYLSSRKADFERAIISLNEGLAPRVVCRIRGNSMVHTSGMRQQVWLTNVEFLYSQDQEKSSN